MESIKPYFPFRQLRGDKGNHDSKSMGGDTGLIQDLQHWKDVNGPVENDEVESITFVDSPDTLISTLDDAVELRDWKYKKIMSLSSVDGPLTCCHVMV